MSKYPWLIPATSVSKNEPSSPSAKEDPKPKSASKAKTKPKTKAKAKTKTKAKAKKKAPSIPDVDIKGCRYSENVLKDVIKEAGLKAKDKKNVLRAALGQDEDLNRYLNKEEITAGAAIVAAQED
ncbi:hypothetical protein DRH13_00145 [Candidatus Woesebacteria bacterium]|nr:MAG: hypothetical protein DRH13_00145 [Candidatus Woesebacteria bacterium]